MVLMTTKEIPYRLNPIGMVSSFARRQVASPFFTFYRLLRAHFFNFLVSLL